MQLTNKRNLAINLGALAILAPGMLELSKHLPPKYFFLAPVLVQAGNYLISHKALNSPSPKGASRKKLILAMTVARDRGLDACLRAEMMFGVELDLLSNAQLDAVIRSMKEEGKRKAAPAQSQEAQ